MRRSLPQFILAVLALGLLLIPQARRPPLSAVEETFVNWLAANSSGTHAPAQVTLVEINDDSLLEYPWPWSPLNYALFLGTALQFHARVAAIAPVLAWDDGALTPEQLLQQPQFENYLHQAILRTPKLELGAQLGFPDDPDIVPPIEPVPVLRYVHGPTDAVPEYTVIESEPGDDLRLTAALGYTNVPGAESTAERKTNRPAPSALPNPNPGIESTADRAPLLFRYRGQMVPSFVLEALMLWYGVTPDDVDVDLGSQIRLGDSLAIPVNMAGAMRVDWQQPYDRAGFDDIELAVDQFERGITPIVSPDKFKDRLLILARTDSASRTVQLPTGRNGSAGELFAAAVATAQSHSFAAPAGWFGDAFVLVIGVALAWAVTVRSKLYLAPLTLAFLAGYLLVCLAVFESSRIALPLTPMLALTLFITAYRLLASAA
ncbi:MAG: hypothetical protein ABSE62_03735 [Chthoniobacteraceae bacterium]|jgi:hypothetical protein